MEGNQQGDMVLCGVIVFGGAIQTPEQRTFNVDEAKRQGYSVTRLPDRALLFKSPQQLKQKGKQS